MEAGGAVRICNAKRSSTPAIREIDGILGDDTTNGSHLDFI